MTNQIRKRGFKKLKSSITIPMKIDHNWNSTKAVKKKKDKLFKKVDLSYHIKYYKYV